MSAVEIQNLFKTGHEKEIEQMGDCNLYLALSFTTSCVLWFANESDDWCFQKFSSRVQCSSVDRVLSRA